MVLRRSRDRVAGAAAGAVSLVLLVVGSVGCTAYPTFDESAPLDCTADDGVQLRMPLVTDAEVGDSVYWSAPDKLGAATSSNDAIEGGGRCGSMHALVLRAEHCNDWGAVYGPNPGVIGLLDVAQYEGIAFWARVARVSARTFTIQLGDMNTEQGDTGEGTTYPSNCVPYLGPAGSSTSTGSQTGTTADNTSMVNGRQPAPNECGNGYNAVLTVTPSWHFYTVPFAAFHQNAQPNRVPNEMLTEAGNVPGTGLLTSAIRTLRFRAPREESLELWLDDVGFYRRTGADPTVDGGGDGSGN